MSLQYIRALVYLLMYSFRLMWMRFMYLEITNKFSTVIMSIFLFLVPYAVQGFVTVALLIIDGTFPTHSRWLPESSTLSPHKLFYAQHSCEIKFASDGCNRPLLSKSGLSLTKVKDVLIFFSLLARYSSKCHKSWDSLRWSYDERTETHLLCPQQNLFLTSNIGCLK